MIPAPEALKHVVECFMINRFNGNQPMAINVFPNATPGIVFHHAEGHPAIQSITMYSGRQSCPATLFLYGPGTESSVMNFRSGSYTVIQVILKPHALPTIFDINAAAVRDCAVELNEFSSQDLNETLLNADSELEQLAYLTKFLLDKLKQARTRDCVIEESLRIIHQCAGAITVKNLLEHFDISERQFERRFSQAVGISPRSYIRVRRFNQALRLMKTGRYNTLTEVAYALNFHDQSHFIRDLKAFTGLSPKSLSQKADGFYHNQAGYSY